MSPYYGNHSSNMITHQGIWNGGFFIIPLVISLVFLLDLILLPCGCGSKLKKGRNISEFSSIGVVE